MIPLESLAVIAASYLVFMLLDYTTAKHLQRHMLKEGCSPTEAAVPLKLGFHMVENIVWAVMAWLIGWWAIPVYYITMYPLALAPRLLVSLLVSLLSMTPKIQAFKDKPIEDQEDFHALLARVKKVRKARKTPLLAKIMWLVLLSASVATHLYLPFSFASNLAQ